MWPLGVRGCLVQTYMRVVSFVTVLSARHWSGEHDVPVVQSLPVPCRADLGSVKRQYPTDPR